MRKLNKPLNYIILLLVGIVGLNIFVAWKRDINSYQNFEEPLAVGEAVELDFLQSGKEKVIFHLKPNCPACLASKSVIDSLYEKFGKKTVFVYAKDFEAQKDLLGVDFEKRPYGAEIWNALHFKFTPQVVVLNEGKVTFRFDLKEGGLNELFKKLEFYLSTKYGI